MHSQVFLKSCHALNICAIRNGLDSKKRHIFWKRKREEKGLSQVKKVGTLRMKKAKTNNNYIATVNVLLVLSSSVVGCYDIQRTKRTYAAIRTA